MAILNNSNAISSGGYDINNSLRFRASPYAYLNRTPASATNRKTWTLSMWIKRGELGTTQDIFGANNDGDEFRFTTSNTLRYYSYSSPTTYIDLTTTQVFRDTSAWYHIVLVVDTTQATSSNRVKMYVNGNQVTAFGTSTYPSQNYDTGINTNTAHYFSRYSAGDNNFFDGYMADINFIDGSAKAASDFGETDTTTGSWKPKAYTGTYGTNGFYLKFSDIATTSGSNAGLGKDFSGNANYWTTNNISVTAGTTYDAMTDSPTLTSATVANYCVMNPLSSTSATLSNANLLVTLSASGGAAGTIAGFTSGKWYYEAVITGGATNSVWLGWLSDAYVKNDNAWSYSTQVALYASLSGNNGNNASYGATYTTNDIIGVAIDLSTSSGSITFYKNGVSQGVMFSSLTTSAIWRPFFSGGSGGQSVAFNFGQRPFAYTPPTGFVALNTFNLPTPTILQGNKYMDATLYTGTGATQVVTNSGSMKPDFVWLKSRSNARNHRLMDTVRGINLGLQSDLTNAEFTGTALSSINSNGFTLNTTDNQNVSAEPYIAWQWQAGAGSTSTNTSGSISSTVSVNTTAGFSIVTYSGNSTSSATVGHGLGVSPSMVIIKNRSAVTNWVVRHSSLSSTQNVSLNTTDAAYTVSSGTANGGVGAFTSTTFGFISGTTGLLSSNQTSNNYVAYCFAAIAGFSRFASYTGNGSTDGPFIYLGFRPKYLLIKCTSTAEQWAIKDTSLVPYNTNNTQFFANAGDAETTDNTYHMTDFLSNGFKIRGAAQNLVNGNGQTYIYMAFAENPFKNSLAR